MERVRKRMSSPPALGLSALAVLVACFLPAAGGAAVDVRVQSGAARQVAENWIARNAVFRHAARSLPQGRSFHVTSVTSLRPAPDIGVMAYHVALQPRGYVVVSADRRLTPVVCFSTTSDLVIDDSDQNALRAMLMNDMAASAGALNSTSPTAGAFAVSAYGAALQKNTERWDLLSATQGSGPPGIDAQQAEPVGPLLETSWSQWRHFNAYCPNDPDPGLGYDGKAPVGCVPATGAQLTKYYAWPPYGQQGHVDVDNNSENLISGSFAADFTDTFDWQNMLPTYDVWAEEPSNAVSAVAELFYELGVLVNVDYGSFNWGGSVAVLSSLGYALSASFFYENGSILRRSDDEELFDAALRDEILGGRPVAASLPGHAFNVDGYMEEEGTEYFHINYGWGGSNDGWYHPSDIGGDSLKDAIIGMMPRPVPLLDRTVADTNVSGTIELSWVFPECRLPLVAAYRFREGELDSTDFIEDADSLDYWTGNIPPWRVESPGHPGKCYRKTGELGTFRLNLRDFIVPGPTALLRFDYRAILVDDHFYVKTSTNGGQSWTVEQHVTGTGWDTGWYGEAVDLSPYEGQETLLRFEYVFASGSYYADNGGVWLDNITIDDIQCVFWEDVDDALPPAATNAAVNGRLDGEYYYAIEAGDGTNWLGSSPQIHVTVALDPDLDVDGDGMANGWESEHFGSVTAAVAEADADGDGFSNLSEYLAGTGPHDQDSFLTLHAAGWDPGGPLLVWPSVTGRIYAVWRSMNLLETPVLFNAVTSGLAATPPTNSFVDTEGTALTSAFYRISVELAP